MPLIRKPTVPGEAAAVPDLAALKSPDIGTRWAAARAAGAHPGAVALLAQALMVESVSNLREAMFTTLVRIGTPESAAAIVPFLRSDDAAVRTGALDALRAMPEHALPHLQILLHDADRDVRLLVCELARGLPSAQSGPLLAELLDREPDINVCAAAIEVLAETGGPEVVPALERCKARFAADPFLGFAIVQTIERIGAKSSGHRG